MLRALLVVVVPFLVVCFLTGASEFQFRFTGLVLQWLGLGTVVHGIEETRKLFGHPSLPQLLREKASRFPRWSRHAAPATGGGAIVGGASLVARGYAWTNLDPAAPLETQVTALNRNVERLKERLDEMERHVDSELSKHSEEFRKEKQEREEGDKNLGKVLEAAETGGLHISLMGVFWLAMGLLLTTFSTEIAQWAM